MNSYIVCWQNKRIFTHVESIRSKIKLPYFGGAWWSKPDLVCVSKLRDMEDLLTSYLYCASRPCPAWRCVCVSWLCNMSLVRSGFLWRAALVCGWSESRDADISPPGCPEKPDCHSAAKLTCTDCQEEPCVLRVQGLHFQISAPIHSFSAGLPQKMHPQASSEKLTLTFWLKNDTSVSIVGHCSRHSYVRKPFPHRLWVCGRTFHVAQESRYLAKVSGSRDWTSL